MKNMKNSEYVARKKCTKFNDILCNFQKEEINFDSCYDLNKKTYINTVSNPVEEKIMKPKINEENLESGKKDYHDLDEDKFFVTNSNFNKTKNVLNKNLSLNIYRPKVFDSNLKQIIKNISQVKKKIDTESKEIEKMLIFTKHVKENYINISKNKNTFPIIKNKKLI